MFVHFLYLVLVSSVNLYFHLLHAIPYPMISASGFLFLILITWVVSVSLDLGGSCTDDFGSSNRLERRIKS